MSENLNDELCWARSPGVGKSPGVSKEANTTFLTTWSRKRKTELDTVAYYFQIISLLPIPDLTGDCEIPYPGLGGTISGEKMTD